MAVKNLKICVIGCGDIVKSRHGPAYQRYKSENPDVEFLACCDIDEARANEIKNTFGFGSAYTSIDKMLTQQKLDAVCLIIPVTLAAAEALKILELGIPLLMEKPPGVIKEETQRLIKAADKNNVSHLIAFNRRYAPLIRKLKQLLDNEYSNLKIQSIQYDMFRVNRNNEDFSTTAIHAIDAAKFIAASDYQKINFTYRDYPEHGNNVFDVFMECKMKNETIININICPITGMNMERITVNLFNHTFFLDYLSNDLNPFGRLILMQKNKIILDITCNDTLEGKEEFEREGFYYENKHFFDCIKNGIKPSGDFRSALQSVEISEFIRNKKEEYILQEDIL
ncbi:MAG: Gfo/Idh/MocA family oxidoreductase [Treponema sp.]|nr:Gfo/Idh/MocA family oxidoreductase [Treponema sp.]